MTVLYLIFVFWNKDEIQKLEETITTILKEEKEEKEVWE